MLVERAWQSACSQNGSLTKTRPLQGGVAVFSLPYNLAVSFLTFLRLSESCVFCAQLTTCPAPDFECVSDELLSLFYRLICSLFISLFVDVFSLLAVAVHLPHSDTVDSTLVPRLFIQANSRLHFIDDLTASWLL